MKKLLLAASLLCIGSQIPATLCAESFSQEGLTYTIIEGADHMVIAQATDVNALTGDLIIPSTVTNGGVTYNVTEIAQNGFRKAKTITSVTIPASITKINSAAFYQSGITDVRISDMNAWMAIEFVKEDANPLFVAKKLSLNGETVTSLSIPAGTKDIKNFIFTNLQTLTSLVLPESLETIGDNAFASCTQLASLSLPESIKKIGTRAFYSCSKLSGELILPQSLGGTDNLTIGNYAFAGTGYNKISMPENLRVLGQYAFSQLANLKYIKIPDALKVIPYAAFYKCTSLDSVTWGANTIGTEQAAFNGCNFKDVVIPEGVKYLGVYAFYLNANLRTIDIAASVDSLGVCAFYAGATNAITSVTVRNSTPPNVGKQLFNAPCYQNAMLVVPSSAIAAYKEAYEWSNFQNIVRLDNGISIVDREDDESESVYYDLHGRRVDPSNLARGIYIVKKGPKTYKQLIP